MTAARKHTLLVVDDEADVCDSVQDLLRKQFTILKAKSAEEAIKLMAEHEVHIIMTDQRMPKVTGVEMLKSAALGHPQAVRMLFTGYADVEAIIAAINQGHIYKFLKKPWQPHELEDAVRDAAAEYDRLMSHTLELRTLRAEVEKLHQRVVALESILARSQERSLEQL